jgi:hypothetical protein
MNPQESVLITFPKVLDGSNFVISKDSTGAFLADEHEKRRNNPSPKAKVILFIKENVICT